MTGCPIHGETEHDGCRLCFLYRTDPRYRKLWGGDETAEPSIFAKVATAAQAIVKHVAAGCPNVSEEEKQRRIALCQVCPEFNADKGTCRKCGCKLKLKAAWALERCPLSRW